ncbi:hypothetical protein D3C71_1588150 [compost metagenome]
MVDLIKLRGRKEELQRTCCLLHHSFKKRFKDFNIIVVRQGTAFFGTSSFFKRQTITVLNFLRQLFTPENLLTRINDFIILHDGQSGHGVTDVQNPNSIYAHWKRI